MERRGPLSQVAEGGLAPVSTPWRPDSTLKHRLRRGCHVAAGTDAGDSLHAAGRNRPGFALATDVAAQETIKASRPDYITSCPWQSLARVRRRVDAGPLDRSRRGEQSEHGTGDLASLGEQLRSAAEVTMVGVQIS
jgi:hypothetical protein